MKRGKIVFSLNYSTRGRYHEPFFTQKSGITDQKGLGRNVFWQSWAKILFSQVCQPETRGAVTPATHISTLQPQNSFLPSLVESELFSEWKIVQFGFTSEEFERTVTFDRLQVTIRVFKKFFSRTTETFAVFETTMWKYVPSKALELKQWQAAWHKIRTVRKTCKRNLSPARHGNGPVSTEGLCFE